MDLKQLFGLDGRIALVTGGSRGIGRMIAEGLLAAGCERVYLDRAQAGRAGRNGSALASARDRPAGRHLDAGRDRGAGGCARRAREREARYTGQQCRRRVGRGIRELPRKRVGQGADLNLRTPFFLTQKFHAPAQGRGKRVSAPPGDQHRLGRRAQDPIRGRPIPTRASKAGLIHMTKRMAARLIADEHCSQRDRTRRIPEFDEQGGARRGGTGRKDGSRRPQVRAVQRYGGRGDLAQQARLGLRGQLDAYRSTAEADASTARTGATLPRRRGFIF